LGDAMINRVMFSLTLVVAVCACSKKDDSAANNVQSPSVSAAAPSKDPPVAANNADPASENSARNKGASEETAIPTEAKDKQHKKPVEKSAHASGEKRSLAAVMRGRWDKFQTMVDECDTKTSSAREECWATARDTYRTANFKCDALGPQRRTDCLRFAERWNNAVADAPSAPVKHVEEPAVTATDPGDPRPAERNRDSTKQH